VFLLLLLLLLLCCSYCYVVIVLFVVTFVVVVVVVAFSVFFFGLNIFVARLGLSHAYYERIRCHNRDTQTRVPQPFESCTDHCFNSQHLGWNENSLSKLRNVSIACNI